MEIVYGTIIALIAGLIQGLTGFGYALITIPLFIKFFSLQETVPIVLLLSLSANIIIIIDCVKEIKIRKIWLLIVSSMVTIPLGSYCLKYVNSDYIKISLGIIIIVFSLLLIFNKSFPIRREKIGYSIAGLFSGFLNGSLSLGGPPVILFLSNQGMNKVSFRANITFYFIVLNLVTIVTFLTNDILTGVVLKKTVFFIPATLFGVLAGIKLSKRVNDKLFKKLTLLLLIISGTWTILSTVKGMMG